MKSNSFEKILQSPYVIIYDHANGNKLHKTSCRFFAEENYHTKVIENQEKNGYYRTLLSIDDLNDTSVKLCGIVSLNNFIKFKDAVQISNLPAFFT